MSIETRNRILVELQSISDLPTLPSVFLKLMRLMRDPNLQIKDISKVVESDPAISMKVLRLVNSSFYGLSRSIDSVHQAVVLLGSSNLKNIVISISIFKSLSDVDKEGGFDRAAFWLHSIGCGTAARYLEKRLGLGSQEEAFIGGITHDIGKVILDKYFNDEFYAALKFSSENKVSIYRAEMELLGTSHAEVGAHIAGQWQLPQKFVDIIAQHHKFDPESENAKQVALIIISDRLVRKFRIGSGGGNFIPKVAPIVWETLGITEDSLSECEEELKAEVEASKDILGEMLK
ncbi:HDOD domain-containing protein [bacterium]|nr:HDOD domain-containing protein [bacterium]MBU1881177.1 HDOD domain-containing protein [bacterium]